MSAANPYAPPSAPVEEPIAAAVLPRASRGHRWLAKVLDNILFFSVAFLVFKVATAMGYRVDPSAGEEDPVTAVSTLIALGLVGTVQLVLLLRRGQTVAKMVFKIRIVRTDGERPNPWRLVVLRSVVPLGISAIPFLNIVFGVADALFIFGTDQRCLHDYLAGTIVVDVRAPKDELLRMGSIRPGEA